jgi:hypothetical protein
MITCGYADLIKQTLKLFSGCVSLLFATKNPGNQGRSSRHVAVIWFAQPLRIQDFREI